MIKISFLIPCYNCENIIKKNNKRLIKKIKKKEIKYELIYINDGSTDKTHQKLKKLSINNNLVKIITYKKNLGKSAALKKGIDLSKYENIIFIDADLPYFSYLNKIIDKLISGSKLVYIDRRSIKSSLNKKKLNLYQISRYLISKLVNYIISKMLFKNFYGDTQSGLKGFKIDNELKKKKFISNKFFLDAEIMLYFHKKKLKFDSIPIRYSPPEVSSIRVFDVNNFKYLFELFKIILKS